MNCAICLEILDSEISTTSCNHKFHKECLKKWYKFQRNGHYNGWGKCPLCRRNSFDDADFKVKPKIRDIILFNIMRILN